MLECLSTPMTLPLLARKLVMGGRSAGALQHQGAQLAVPRPASANSINIKQTRMSAVEDCCQLEVKLLSALGELS